MPANMIKRLLKNLENAVDDPFSQLLDEYLIARVRSPQRLDHHTISMKPRPRPAGRLSPSGLGECQRRAVFQFTGTPRRNALNLDLELIFENGNWMHHKWQAIFLDMELVLGPEVFQVISIEGKTAMKSLRIAGSLDAHVVISGEEFIIDIKSINDYGFGANTREGEANPHHIEQLDAYMKAKNVEKGFLLYDNKNTNNIGVFMVVYNEDRWEATKVWCRAVLKALQQNVLPQKHYDCSRTSYMAKKCPFSYLCYGDQDEKLVDIAYRNFHSIDESWHRGLKIINRWERDVQSLHADH